MPRRVPLRAVGIIGGLVVWELAVRIFDISPLFLTPPTGIFKEFRRLIDQGTLWNNMSISLEQVGLGFLIAAVLAIPFGLLLGAVRILRELLEPWVQALYATPNIALAPLFLVWLGFGLTSKAAIIALVAFFPIAVNTTAGVDALEKKYLDVSRAFGASRREVFFKILLPGTRPFIFAGLSLAWARALVGLVVADFFGSQRGLGFLILNAAQTFDTPRLFVGAVILAGMGVIGMQFLRAVELRMSPWMRANNSKKGA